MLKIKKIYNLILKKGLSTYKIKNSKASLPQRIAAERVEKTTRQGGIFVVRQKEDFTPTGVKGFIVTSKEALLQQANHLTHWTPNVYRNYHYTDAKRSYICGFEEKHLQQINTFVVDIDTKKHSVQDIVMASLDESIGVPTLIVSSPRGYQVYYALEEPLFISNKNDFRGLKVAKRIADNIKRSLASVDADSYCNDFGFFRIPNEHNVVFSQLQQTYTIADLINWSMRQDDDVQRPLFVVPVKRTNNPVTSAEWFEALIHTKKIKGSKGILGRNNTIFTLALACYSEGWDKARAANLLDEFNSYLEVPLADRSVQTILTSAYSGKYRGPKKAYIEALLTEYVTGAENITITLEQNYWYKHKKDRSERVRSHYEEWEQDIVEYIAVQKNDSEPFIQHTQKQLCEALDIPQSTLNVLIKQSKQIIRKVSGKGRGAITYWTTVELFMQHIIQLNKEKPEMFIGYARDIMNKWHDTIEYNPASIMAFNYLEKLLKPPTDIGFERVSGGG